MFDTRRQNIAARRVRNGPKRAWARLKSVHNVVQLGHAPIEQDAHGIEAHVLGIELSFREVLFGEGTDRRSLAWSDGFEGVPVSGAGSELDLDEDERRAVAKDQVDLAPARAVIALDEVESAVLEKLEREVLAPPPGGASLQLPTPA